MNDVVSKEDWDLDRVCRGFDFHLYPCAISNFENKGYADDFELVRCMACGCGFNGAAGNLTIIYKITKEKMLAPNSSKIPEKQLKSLIADNGRCPFGYESWSYERLVEWWDEEVVFKCERIMKEIVRSAVLLQYGDVQCKRILDELSTIDNQFCRLTVCGNIEDPSKFLIDEDERVAKVARIRLEFMQKWMNSSVDYKKQIAFLSTALDYGVIQCSDGLTGDADSISAKFESPLFKKNTGWIGHFDRDVFSTIGDTRVLADYLNQLIEVGVIELQDDVLRTEKYLARMRERLYN